MIRAIDKFYVVCQSKHTSVKTFETYLHAIWALTATGIKLHDSIAILVEALEKGGKIPPAEE